MVWKGKCEICIESGCIEEDIICVWEFLFGVLEYWLIVFDWREELVDIEFVLLLLVVERVGCNLNIVS